MKEEILKAWRELGDRLKSHADRLEAVKPEEFSEVYFACIDDMQSVVNKSVQGFSKARPQGEGRGLR